MGLERLAQQGLERLDCSSQAGVGRSGSTSNGSEQAATFEAAKATNDEIGRQWLGICEYFVGQLWHCLKPPRRMLEGCPSFVGGVRAVGVPIFSPVLFCALYGS